MLSADFNLSLNVLTWSRRKRIRFFKTFLDDSKLLFGVLILPLIEFVTERVLHRFVRVLAWAWELKMSHRNRFGSCGRLECCLARHLNCAIVLNSNLMRNFVLTWAKRAAYRFFIESANV